MKVGDIVKYKNAESSKVTGEVKQVKGKKWLCVNWSDGVNLSEHVDDLVFFGK
tara:strand:- start:304 stop:462 length:159 start_codon:yes stop_codon:yes gene_type:complete